MDSSDSGQSSSRSRKATLPVLSIFVASAGYATYLAEPNSLATRCCLLAMTVLAPAVVWLMEPGGLRACYKRMLGVSLAGLLIARLLRIAKVPRELVLAVALVELVAIAVALVVVHRRFRAQRASEPHGHPFPQFVEGFAGVFGGSPLARLVGQEIALLLVLFGLGRSAPVSRQLTDRRLSEWSALTLGFVALIVFESVALHALLAGWLGTTATVVVACLNLYALLWLVGDNLALKRCTSELTSDTLEVRLGLRVGTSVPLKRIARVHTVAPVEIEKSETLRCWLLGPPNLWLTLTDPMAAPRLARQDGVVRWIGFDLASADQVAAEIRARCGGDGSAREVLD